MSKPIAHRGAITPRCPSCRAKYSLKNAISLAEKRDTKHLECPNCKRKVGTAH